jgi:hypothetical protein
MVFRRILGENINLDINSLTRQYLLIEYTLYFCEFTPEYPNSCFIALGSQFLYFKINLI